MFGVDPIYGGSFELAGAPFTPSHTSKAVGRGLFLVPEDRKGAGLVLDLPIAQNISLPDLPGRIGSLPGTGQTKAPPALAGLSFRQCRDDYMAADEDDGAIGDGSDELEAAADELGAIGVSDDEATEASDEDEAGAADEDGAIGVSDEDETTGASEDEETTAAEDDEVVVTVVVVAGPRLKIQIRPMITITTTMMIIQVLRFMG